MIRLNPYKFKFSDWDRFNFFIYIICEDGDIAEEIAVLDLPEDKYERLFGRPKPTAINKKEDDKFDILANEKRIVVPDGALDGKSKKGEDDEKTSLLRKNSPNVS